MTHRSPKLALLAAASLTALSSVALAEPPRAADLPTSLSEPPRGPGTERGVVRFDDRYRVEPGPEAGGFIGGGRGLGLGLGGRIGYSFRPGVYLGGEFTWFSRDAAELAAELGYELFPTRHWQFRPFVLAGPAFVGHSSRTRLAVAPSFLAAYHFGIAFISAEARAYVSPEPGTLAVFGGGGVALM